MRLSTATRMLILIVAIVAIALPTAGCGGKKKGKKGGLTIKQQLDKAEGESTPDRQAAALLKVARAQLAAGDKSGAKSSVTKAFDRVKEVKEDADANLFAPRLIETGELFVALGDKKQARKSLELATDSATIGKIDDAVRRTKVLADAGAIYGDKVEGIGDSKLAKDTLAKAANVADGVEERFRAEALAAVALGYTRSGLAEAASDMVGKLEEAAKALEEPRAKAEALAAAANVKAQTGKKDEATELLQEAAASAKSVERPESKAYALLAVALATDANGDTKQALTLLKEADKAANKVAEPDAMKMVVDKVRALTMKLEKKK